MADEFNSLQTLNEYKGTWGVEAGSKTATVVAPTMEAAARVLNEEGSDIDPVIIQCIKQQIKVQMPEIYVTFNTEAVDSSGVAQVTCQAYPKQYTLLAGTKQVFTAVPGEGFKFLKWTIDGEEAIDATDPEGTKVATDPVSVLRIPAKATTVKIAAVFTTSP